MCFTRYFTSTSEEKPLLQAPLYLLGITMSRTGQVTSVTDLLLQQGHIVNKRINK